MDGYTTGVPVPAVTDGRDTTQTWRHTLQVRTTDRSGYLQTSQQAPTIPNGATGWHTVSVTAT